MLQHFGEVQSVTKRSRRLKLVLVNIPFPEVCHERLVLFFTDFVLSIVRTLVSATPRGDLGRWVCLGIKLIKQDLAHAPASHAPSTHLIAKFCLVLILFMLADYSQKKAQRELSFLIYRSRILQECKK